jgi:hypothetical protein
MTVAVQSVRSDSLGGPVDPDVTYTRLTAPGKFPFPTSQVKIAVVCKKNYMLKGNEKNGLRRNLNESRKMPRIENVRRTDNTKQIATIRILINLVWWEVNCYSDDAVEALASLAPDGITAMHASRIHKLPVVEQPEIPSLG